MSTSPQQLIVSVKNLRKDYPTGFSLGEASFDLGINTTVGFLGPNGAGKSTLFQLLTGNLDPSSGQIFFENRKLTPDAFEIKRKIGYLPQNLTLPRWVSGREILLYASRLYEIDNPNERIKDMMIKWDCQSYGHLPLAACSHGMQKRVGLALANLHSPKLLILDEPFAGLDLYHTETLKSLIRSRQELGQCTVLSTHISPYVAELCSAVYLITKGKIKELELWSRCSEQEKMTQIHRAFFTKIQD